MEIKVTTDIAPPQEAGVLEWRYAMHAPRIGDWYLTPKGWRRAAININGAKLLVAIPTAREFVHRFKIGQYIVGDNVGNCCVTSIDADDADRYIIVCPSGLRGYATAMSYWKPYPEGQTPPEFLKWRYFTRGERLIRTTGEKTENWSVARAWEGGGVVRSWKGGSTYTADKYIIAGWTEIIEAEALAKIAELSKPTPEVRCERRTSQGLYACGWQGLASELTLTIIGINQYISCPTCNSIIFNSVKE